ncbi:MAG: thiol peroxidase [Armatimonadetes bacterium]|nr:thiol peroxidase [Anaerolineae bacterium]
MKVGPNEHRVQHEMLAVGTSAPDFTLTATDQSQRTLQTYNGKVKILSCVPSVDTSVCSAQTRRFNQEAAALGTDAIVIVTVSADLPFALRRYCTTEGIENSETLSDHRTMQFADAYGVHDLDWRVLQRAVFVVDRENVVQYAEYMPSIGEEVNFDAVLEKARALV